MWPAGSRRIFGSACRGRGRRYAEYLRDFCVGTAALNSPKTLNDARPYLDRAIELIPEEPAGWANRGLLNLRDNQLDEAARDLKRAHELAPDCGEIEANLGQLAWRQGRAEAALAHLRKAVEKGPLDLATIFTLADVLNEPSSPEHDTEIQKLMKRVLAAQPNNLRARLVQAETALRRDDQPALRENLDRIDRLAAGWSERSRKQLAMVHEALKKAARMRRSSSRSCTTWSKVSAATRATRATFIRMCKTALRSIISCACTNLRRCPRRPISRWPSPSDAGRAPRRSRGWRSRAGTY